MSKTPIGPSPENAPPPRTRGNKTSPIGPAGNKPKGNSGNKPGKTTGGH